MLTSRSTTSKGAAMSWLQSYTGLSLADYKRDGRKLANVVTQLRLVLAWVPGAIVLVSPKGSGWWWLAAALFALIAATDALDGRLARKRDEVTELGKFLDPLVDKVLVTTTLLALCLVMPVLWIPTGIIVIREAWVTFVLRGAAQKGGIIPAVTSGKVKMALQCVMIVVLIIPGDNGWIIAQITAVVAAICATVWSWIDYQRRFGLKG